MSNTVMAALTPVTAVILAGGLGTRLQSILSDRPKVLAEVNRLPFIVYLLDQIMAAGIQRAVVCIGYKGDQVSSALGSRYGRLELLYSSETAPLGTGGALRQALPFMVSDPVLVMNGDSYFTADIPHFCRRHASAGARVSILLARADDTGRYGRVEVEPDGAVVRFIEKGEDRSAGWINAGIYLIRLDQIRRIPAHRSVSLEKEVLPSFIGDKFFGFKDPGEFIDIGTPQSYRRADAFMQAFLKIQGDSPADPSAVC
jgi:NDP-sugar pyrophosphorylase family protein